MREKKSLVKNLSQDEIVLANPVTRVQEILIRDDVSEVDVFSNVALNIEEEKQLWHYILRTYRFDQSASVQIDDSKALLSQVATLWVRLGLTILSDAEGNDETVDPDVLLAIKGLKQCAINFIISNGITEDLLTLLHHERLDSDLHNDAFSSMQNKHIKKSGVDASRRHASRELSLKDSEKKELEAQRVQYCINNRHMISVLLVYMLGLIKRVMHRYSSGGGNQHNEKSQLMFLFTQLKEGNFPLTEISRENFQTLVDKTVGVSVKNWAKFDALCQRVDPENKGFMQPVRVLSAFQSLCPFSDYFPKITQEEAQQHTLSLLTLSSENICFHRSGKLLSEIFSSIIVEHQSLIPSFAALLKVISIFISCSTLPYQFSTCHDILFQTYMLLSL